MSILYFKSNTLIKEFSFLEGMGFKVVEIDDNNQGATVEFSNGIIRVRLSFDYRDFFFYFSLIRGATKYPNDHDHENIKTFWDLALRKEPDFDLQKLQPQKDIGAFQALKENANLLKSKGVDILKGKEWF